MVVICRDCQEKKPPEQYGSGYLSCNACRNARKTKRWSFDVPLPWQTCTTCKLQKNLTEFTPDKRVRNGHTRQCKACNKLWRQANPEKARLKPYNLSLAEFDRMWDEQNGACFGCFKTFKRLGRHKEVAHVDHCHVSNKVRGLLCQDCNVSIGRLKDRPEVLRRLADYLEKRP